MNKDATLIALTKGFMDEEEGQYLYGWRKKRASSVPVWKLAVIAENQPCIWAVPAKRTSPFFFPSTITGDRKNNSPVKNISTRICWTQSPKESIPSDGFGRPLKKPPWKRRSFPWSAAHVWLPEAGPPPLPWCLLTAAMPMKPHLLITIHGQDMSCPADISSFTIYLQTPQKEAKPLTKFIKLPLHPACFENCPCLRRLAFSSDYPVETFHNIFLNVTTGYHLIQ